MNLFSCHLPTEVFITDEGKDMTSASVHSFSFLLELSEIILDTISSPLKVSRNTALVKFSSNILRYTKGLNPINRNHYVA